MLILNECIKMPKKQILKYIEYFHSIFLKNKQTFYTIYIKLCIQNMKK